MRTKSLLLIGLTLCTVLITGCSGPKKTLYCYDQSYPDALYLYLQDDPDYAKQMELMNDYFNKARETNNPPAPGSYAHMGILFSKNNDMGEAEKYFNLEKEHFPESIHYIDFLMKQDKQRKEKQASEAKENTSAKESGK